MKSFANENNKKSLLNQKSLCGCHSLFLTAAYTIRILYLHCIFCYVYEILPLHVSKIFCMLKNKKARFYWATTARVLSHSVALFAWTRRFPDV